MTARHHFPNLYLSLPHMCSYLPERLASTLFMDPHHPLNPDLYSNFNRHGFRRSGDLIYRPHCQDCSECVSVRIPVERFRATRGQRRTRARNSDIQVAVLEPRFEQEHFELFLRYQDKRHPGSSMANPSPDRYMRFLVGRQIETRFVEFRRDGNLLAVAIIDLLTDGLSAVYTFYEPDLRARGLGVYSILWEIDYTRGLGLPWLYLGYWIRESPKMAYKMNYQPLEAYQGGRWSAVEDQVA